MKKVILLLLLALPMIAYNQVIDDCATTNVSETESISLYEKIIDYTKTKLGLGYGRRGLDCSGLVSKAFNSVGITLPHSSKMQSKLGKRVTKNEALPGDLIFFSSPRSGKKKVGHVGIITSVTESGIQFIHAAVKGGIQYDNLKSTYYMKHFMMIKRHFFQTQVAKNQ
ncbi:MAG: C40 family peptidase [Bacteroidota bacterium]